MFDFHFIVFSQSTFSRPDTLLCVFGNRSYRVMFFLLFDTPHQLKHLVLRAFPAGNLPKKLSKLGVLDERGMKKSKKTLHRSEVRVTFAVKTYGFCTIWNSPPDPPDPPDPAEVVAASAPQTPTFHTRRGPG